MNLYFIDNILSRFSPDVAIDLGTANNPVLIRGKGIVMSEPSYVARERHSGKILALGHEARQMEGRTPENIEVIRPLKKGVIADFDTALEMIRYLLRRANTQGLLRPRVVLGIPSDTTDVEKRAAAEAAHSAGARVVYVIQQPVAAAIGAGLDILKPRGNMVLDIGGGTSEIAIVSLGGVVLSSCLRLAGDDMTEAIINHVRRYHNLLIGEKTAEEMKIDAGCAFPMGGSLYTQIRGRSLTSGMPKSIEISGDEVAEAVYDVLRQMVEMIYNVLESTPPELSSDIAQYGAVMCGGGSLLRGLDRVLARELGIPFRLAEEPLSSVVLGLEKILSDKKLADRLLPDRY
ncbi:MAG: rod shape-determining protein [Chloroflexi bacterium]|nr:rod shape-determining protein [Chloroflexota bacterium]